MSASSPLVSSLNTLNVAFSGAMATYIAKKLNYELQQAGLSSVDDLDTDMHLIKRRSQGDESIEKMPAMVCSRASIARELAQRVNDSKFLAQVDGKELAVDYRLVTATYSVRIYTNDIEDAEYLIDQLILLSEAAFTFKYDMPGVTTDSAPMLGVSHILVPSIQNNYVTVAGKEKSGEYFQIKFEVQTRALLMGLPKRAALIKEIFFTVYDKTLVEGLSGPDYENINPHENGTPFIGQIRID